MKIVTSYWAKPSPIRALDWEAVTDNYDLGSPIGFGATEADAIADLKDRLEEMEDARAAVAKAEGR